MLNRIWFGIVWTVRSWFGLSTLVVSCGCELHYTVDQFRTLDGLGVVFDSDFPCDTMDWRTCVCGSTRTIAVRADGTFNQWRQKSS